MGKVAEIVLQMRSKPQNVRFADLCMVCDCYFGTARQKGSSHRIYKTPWQGDPRINIQNDKGKAKVYQVKQVLKAIEILEVNYGAEK
jgi:predicted RNA binding protein YcfA (HicA-like mRNA interferase family)